jgi:hypothetical protein
MNPEEARLRSIIGKLIRSSTEFIPVVAFRNGRKIDCDPEIFDYPVFGVGECSRVQVSQFSQCCLQSNVLLYTGALCI